MHDLLSTTVSRRIKRDQRERFGSFKLPALWIWSLDRKSIIYYRIVLDLAGATIRVDSVIEFGEAIAI